MAIRTSNVSGPPSMTSPETNRKMTSARIDSTAAIADFLNRVLAGGALAVAELEVAASESPSVVQQWLDGVQRLDYVRSPPAVPPIRWQLFLGDCHSFLSSSEKSAERAAALGWNALALFGCYRTRPLEHLGSAGLLWVINGGKLVELHRDWAVIERAQDRSRQIHHRRSLNAANMMLPWLGAASVRMDEH